MTIVDTRRPTRRSVYDSFGMPKSANTMQANTALHQRHTHTHQKNHLVDGASQTAITLSTTKTITSATHIKQPFISIKQPQPTKSTDQPITINQQKSLNPSHSTILHQKHLLDSAPQSHQPITIIPKTLINQSQSTKLTVPSRRRTTKIPTDHHQPNHIHQAKLQSRLNTFQAIAINQS